MDPRSRKIQTLANAEEQHLVEISSSVKKLSKNVEVKAEISQCFEESEQKQNREVINCKKKITSTRNDDIETTEVTGSNNDEGNGKKKLRAKKSKKATTDNQNISVKSSFNKFEALQNRKLIHVRSSDADKAQEKFSIPQGEKEMNCRLCLKPVYKMEEIKAEKFRFHKNCFRCHECNKQLKVDNYRSHDSTLYCLMHFKLLFVAKSIDDNEPVKPLKPELIIRENQPLELPPDVVRASDKPDLGLDELQQLNVRSRFQVFEQAQQQPTSAANANELNKSTVVRHSSSILSKLAKLQQLGFTTNLSAKDMAEHLDDSSGISDDVAADNSASETDDYGDSKDMDLDLVRSKKCTHREYPNGLAGNAMNDIKNKFEKGQLLTKEERREERKQEIQNIRSRLFLGKQARIKEMYQQAVADSEHVATKKPEIILDGAARSIKERFEKGEFFKEKHYENEDTETYIGNRSGGIHDEADVFESAISKKSRSIFMELDANVAAEKNQAILNKPKVVQPLKQRWHTQNSEYEHENVANDPTHQFSANVKYYEKPDDIQIQTSEIRSKFNFFESYCPTECEKKEFRITPPRENDVNVPNHNLSNDNATSYNQDQNETKMVEKSQTTSLMLNKFREMEQNKNKLDEGPKPLKCFTPPPDGNRRLYQSQDSDVDSSQEDDDDYDDVDEDNDEDDFSTTTRSKMQTDEALKEAQTALRAKLLRVKFENWEANEQQRELNDERIDIYSDQNSDNTCIESTKTIRERFENMKHNTEKSPTKPRYQVNRFI